MKYLVYLVMFVSLSGQTVLADGQPERARDIGVPFEGTPGALNAITDVAGITVGQETIIRDEKAGAAVRTGVTVVVPRGKETNDWPVFAASFALNGNGEMTGRTWIEESGMLEGPVLITNTHSVGIVHEAAIAWRVAAGGADASGYWWSVPTVAETWDGHLNDINGFHVKREHVWAALDHAKGGPVAEGNVGGGTGMTCHEFKCGIGTSSRVAKTTDGPYTVGVLVQANYGIRDTLTIAGVPVGKHLRDNLMYAETETIAPETGSIIIVVATDAPLLPQQLKRLARRASLGLARNGSYAGNGSGDIFIAFSTANNKVGQSGPAAALTMMTNETMDPLFLATVQATEEAIINSMIAAKDMTGHEGHQVKAISHEALRKVLKQYNRLAE